MIKRRRRFKQATSFKERLSVWAADVRAQAAKLKPGPEQEALLARARRADTAAHLDDWANSTNLRSPE